MSTSMRMFCIVFVTAFVSVVGTLWLRPAQIKEHVAFVVDTGTPSPRAYYYNTDENNFDVSGHSTRSPHITGGGHSVGPPADGTVYWFKITQESTTCTPLKAEEPQR